MPANNVHHGPPGHDGSPELESLIVDEPAAGDGHLGTIIFIVVAAPFAVDLPRSGNRRATGRQSNRIPSQASSTCFVILHLFVAPHAGKITPAFVPTASTSSATRISMGVYLNRRRTRSPYTHVNGHCSPTRASTPVYYSIYLRIASVSVSSHRSHLCMLQSSVGPNHAHRFP